MIKRKINQQLKFTILAVTVLIIMFFILRHFAESLKNLDYFKIKDITVNKPENRFDFSYLLGRNIFNVDLKKESRYILQLSPTYKNIRLFKVLPSRLFIGFTDRQGLAYVRLYRNFCVDNEGVLFDAPENPKLSDLPVITGLERKIAAPKLGRSYNIRELNSALNILKEAKANGLLKKYKIARIDVANPAAISCFMPLLAYSEGKSVKDYGFIELKIGYEDIGDKIRVLDSLFTQMKGDIGKVKYIDLRFKEPVVKFADADR